MQYGLMTATDYQTMDKVLGMVLEVFPEGIINTCEIGVHRGDGSRGIHKFITDAGRINFHTGIDNQHDFAMGSPFEGCNFIIGSSIEVYNQIADNSQHFLLIDGCHNYALTMADFLVYSDKVRVGGFVAFHDTGEQIKPMTDFQGMGDKDDPDMYISCRKAVKKLGLFDDTFPGWKYQFSIWDDQFHTGGITVVKRIK